MKKTYKTSRKVHKSGDSWRKHLRKPGKKRANKSTRKVKKLDLIEE